MDGFTALCYAAEEGHLACVNTLVEAGAEVDSRSSHKCTPLFQSAKGGAVEVLTYLLDHGADPNAEATDGATAIFEAAKVGNTKILASLRSRGADPFHGVNYGATPLHISAFNGHIDCLSLLLSWGADVNRVTSEGCTPLHYAAYMGQPNCVSLLLKMGCDPSITSVRSTWSERHENFNRTAADYAAELYSCSTADCVCHQQAAPAVLKAQCLQRLKDWANSVKPLQHYCRMTIRGGIRDGTFGSLPSLGLPASLNSYISFAHEMERTES